MWAILLINKVLAQYHDAVGEPRVLDAISHSLRAMARGLDRTPLYDWGRFRWYKGLVPIYYVYQRRPEPWLLDLARKLRSQGVDFEAMFRSDDLMIATPRRGLWKWTKHVVNTAMATKASALSWRLDQRPADRAWGTEMIAFLDRYHGQVTGMFSGDECLSGRNPLQGTELCAVVEFMYSLEVLFSVFGNPLFGDRLERVAFNALPAAIAPDMWSHQYDQQVNQVQCTINPEFGWSTNGPESNLFGLEPNYGCCTSNMHQGWPKLVTHLWMQTPDEGVVVAAYAPNRVRFSAKGIGVEAVMETDYPFRETVRLSVTPERAVRFPLLLRVPAWAAGATVEIESGNAPADAAGHASPTRTRVDRSNRAVDPFPDDGAGHAAIQRRRRDRTRAPGLLVEARGAMDPRQRRQAASRAAPWRLRGEAGRAVELRFDWIRRRCGRAAVRGAGDRRATLLARGRRHDGDGTGEASARLETRTWLGGGALVLGSHLGRSRAAARVGAGRGHHADPVWLHQYQDHGVPAINVTPSRADHNLPPPDGSTVPQIYGPSGDEP